MNVVFKANWYEDVATVTFVVRNVNLEEHRIWVDVNITSHEFKVVLPAWFFGFDIRKFIDELNPLYATLEGSARLEDFDGLCRFCFTVVSKPRGLIALGAKLRVLDGAVTVHPSKDHFLGEFLETGILFAIEGLELDQTYLPALIEQFETLLRDSGVSVANPLDKMF